MGALRTGNPIVDMLIAMAVPLIFKLVLDAAHTTSLREILGQILFFWSSYYTREIEHKVLQNGWGNMVNMDKDLRNNVLIKAIQLYLDNQKIEYRNASVALVSMQQSRQSCWGDDDDEGEQNSVTERAGDQDAGAAAEGAEGEQGEGRRRVSNRQVTWVEGLPRDNQIVAGTWWDENPQPGFVSLEDDYAERLGASLGDIVEFDIGQGQLIEAQVQSLRSVRWDNMQPNFFVIFSPGTLDAMGGTYLSTALMAMEQKSLINELLREYPTIVVIEIDALIEQIQTIIAQVTSAIELIAFLVLACGALVLLACVTATLDERFRENAILRTLGAGRKLILSSLFIEFASIGLIAGIIATLGAEGSLFYLQTQVFQQEFNLHYWVWLAGPLTGMGVIAVLGVMATRRVVNTSPLTVLRHIG
jgi:putative ABC transport system permease protein